MISKKIALVAAAALMVLGLAASSAQAQRITNSAGVTVPNGTVLRAGPSTATLTTSLGNISCQLRLEGNVTSASTVNVYILNWTGCTDTIPLFNVCSTATDGLPTNEALWGPGPFPAGRLATVTTATATGGTLTLANTTVTVNVTPCNAPQTCKYGATVNVTANNAANTLSVNQTVPQVAGSTFGSCPPSGTFATALNPVYADIDNSNTYTPGGGDYLVQVRP